MSRKNLLYVGVGWAGALATMVAIVTWYNRPYEVDSDFAVFWVTAGEESTLTVHVRNEFGEPVEGVAIHADDVSGGSTTKTNLEGRATFAPRNGELNGLSINGRKVMSRILDFGPSTRNGLQVHVLAKAVALDGQRAPGT